jgi:hypothetical protein
MSRVPVLSLVCSLFLFSPGAEAVQADYRVSVAKTRAQFSGNCRWDPISNRRTCDVVTDWGSAVCVGEMDDGRKVFATCWHNVKPVYENWDRDKNFRFDIVLNGQSFPASVLTGNTSRDYALISIQGHGVHVELEL